MRIWRNRGPTDASVHCLGNGELAVYARGPEVVQVFGPPYSSTSSVSVSVAAEGTLEVRSERERGTAVWRHELFIDETPIGRMVDFVDAQVPAFIRILELGAPLVFELLVREGVETLDNRERFRQRGASSALLTTAPRGTFVFMKYPSPIPFSHQIVVTGRASMYPDVGGATWRIRCEPGASTVAVVGGSTYPECIVNTESVLATPTAELLERTRAAWRAFTQRRRDFEAEIPSDAPRRADLLQAVDDVAVLIKAQQGQEGGILAGLFYHWAAFRDQFGAMRCLLALGHVGEAREVLCYYWDIFRTRGALHNGQDIGLNGFFHIHENDEVEITGYLLTQALDYWQATRDDPFLCEILPMLEWAFDAQVRNLRRQMLPFNGDETYIAGGMMPRGVINDGSAESTLLFITGGSRLLSWIERERRWPPDRLADARRAVEETRTHYRENFWRDGAILTNNPERMMIAEMPRFRHGVCESGGRSVENRGLRCQGGAIGWVEKTADGHYLCPSCFSRGLAIPAGRPIYHLASVSLVPLYLGSDLFSRKEIAAVASEIFGRYDRTGRLSATSDDTTTVGYDYGLLLYTLTELAHPLAGRVYEHLLDVRDSTGAWVEYYREDRPTGCPCRPYESGINLEAALYFALRATA